jgi:uncharacterized protein YjaZ
MSKHKLKIKYHLPQDDEFTNAKELFEAVAEPATKEKKWWGGFKGKKYLKEALMEKYKDADVSVYKPLNKTQRKKVEETGSKTAGKITKVLQPPKFDITAHVYPWFQGKDMEMFDGVNGKTFFGNSFHLYLDTQKFTHQSLRNTLAHEYNHAVRNQHFSVSEQTISDAIVMEGLAEHFREHVVGGESAPWSKALDRQEAEKFLQEIQGDLQASIGDRELYGKVFYGQEEIPRWTGYSIGYQLVGNFLEKELNKQWPNIMKMPTSRFFEVGL